jgi:hypothetical protein
MKTISIILFIFISLIGYSQTSDLLIVPTQNSLVTTYKSVSPIGMYVGGQYLTSIPQPYTYTTPFRVFNRLGVLLGGNKVSVMVGIFSEFDNLDIKVRPDAWIKINPLRMLLDLNTGFDLSLGLNYSNGFNYGIGFSFTY